MNLKSLSLISLSLLILTGCAMLPYRNSFQCERGKNSGVCGSVSDIYELSSDMDDLRLRTLDEKDEKEIKQAKLKEQEEALKSAKLDFKHKKLQEMVEAVEIRNIQNEHPAIFRFFLDESKKDNKSSYLALYNEANKDNKKVQKPKKTTKTQTTKKTKANVVNSIDKGLKPSVTDKVGNDSNSSKRNTYLVSNDENLTAIKDLNASLDNKLQQAYVKGKESVDCSASGGKRTDINAEVRVCVYAANIRKEPSCKAQVLRIANNNEVLFALYEQDGWVRLNDGTYIHKSIITRD